MTKTTTILSTLALLVAVVACDKNEGEPKTEDKSE